MKNKHPSSNYLGFKARLKAFKILMLSIMILQYILNPFANIGFADEVAPIPSETSDIENPNPEQASEKVAPNIQEDNNIQENGISQEDNNSIPQENSTTLESLISQTDGNGNTPSDGSVSSETGTNNYSSGITDQINTDTTQISTGSNNGNVMKTGSNEFNNLALDSTQNTHAIDTGSILNTQEEFMVIVKENSVGFLRLRADATSNSEELDQIPLGTQLQVIGIKDGFYKVIYNTKEGWISSDYVDNSSNNKDEIISPELLSNPQKILKQNNEHELILDSIDSYNYTNGGMSYCSYITRLNLERISGLRSNDGIQQDSSMINKGDAIYLIAEGITRNSFQSFHRNTFNTIISYLDNQSFTIIDGYAFHNQGVSSEVKKGHRFVAIKASDNNRYVLDPIIIKSNNPLGLEQYLQLLESYDSSIHLQKLGYYPSSSIRSDSNQVNIVRSIFDILSLGLHNKIQTHLDAFGSPVQLNFLEDFVWINNDLQAELPSGLSIKAKGGATLNTTQFLLNEDIDPNFITNAKFGIKGQHLIFSKPVRLTLPITDLPEGHIVEVKVKHEGETDYGSMGITNNPNASCDNDGKSSNEHNSFPVIHGEVSFYTCGASSFVINTLGSGNITFTQPISGTNTHNQYPTFAGSGDTEGTIVRLFLSGSSTYVGIGIVEGGSRQFTPSTPIGTGEHVVCASSNCTTFTITDNIDPTTIDDTINTTINTAVSFDPLTNDSDSNGDILALMQIHGSYIIPNTAINAGSGIIVISATGLVTFTPNTSFIGAVNLEYLISDNNGGLSTGLISINVAGPAGALDCSMLYASSIANGTLADPTIIVRLDPTTNTATDSGIRLQGRTRAAAITKDGSRIYYIDDLLAGGTLEYLDVATNSTTTTSYILPTKFQQQSRVFTHPGGTFTYTVGQSATRMGCSKNGKCYMLFGDNTDLLNRVTFTPPSTIIQNGSDQILVEIDTITNTVTEIGDLLDVAGNSISVDVLAGGDIMFDDANKGYVIDNNGQFFKFDLTSRSSTYLGLMGGVAGAVPAGLAYSPTGNPYYFGALNSVAPKTNNIAEIDLVAINSYIRTTFNAQMGDAFSCSFPVLSSQPSMPKSFYRIDGANMDGLGGYRITTADITPGDIIEYEIIIHNGGKLPLINSKFQDQIPNGTVYINNSTKLNGINVNDSGGTMPYANYTFIQSPGQITGRMLADSTPNTIDREAVISFRVRINDPATTMRISNQANFTADDILTTYSHDPNSNTGNNSTNINLGQNTNPIAINDTYTTAANTPVDLNPLSGDTDPDGHLLSITSINGTTLTPGVAQTIVVPNGLVTVSSTGVITFIPNAGFVGVASFPYTISDGNGGTATATETITITNTNPIAINDTYTTAANTPVDLNPLSGDTDPDGHLLSITSINGTTLTPGVAQTIVVPNGLVTVSSTGVITFIPNAGFVGVASFPYTISDGNGGTATATETITITNTNPIAINDTYTTAANTPVDLNPLSGDTDPDGHTLSITSINGVALTPGTAQTIVVQNGTVLISNTGSISFAPNTGYVGVVSFPYVISDSNGGTANATEVITIINTNPIAIDDNYSTPANTPVSLIPLSGDSDPDGHTLSITSINGVALTPGTAQTIVVPHGLITISITGTITFIPDPLYTGPTGFPYTITDGNGGTDSANVSIDVLNTDPVAIDNYYTGAVGVSILLQPLVNDSDVDGHNLTITTINGLTVTPGVAQNIVVTGGVVTIDIAGNIIFIPNSGFTGSVAIPYTIIDGHGGTDTATIYINSTNNPPIAQNDTGSTIIGTPVILSPLGNDTDPDGNPLTITEINGTPVIPGTIVPVSGGTATLNPDGTISFTPNPGFTGDVVISYTISDGHGGTDTAVITISITGNPIAANDDAYTTQTNTPVVIDTLNNDVSPLGDDLTISSVNGVPLTPGVAQSIPVSGGVVNIASNGVMTFAPDTGFVGVVTFPYGVIDELGNTDTAIAIITVENTSPIVNNDSISTIPSTPVIIHPLTNDSDPDEHLLTITEINGTPVIPGTIVPVSGGTATLNPDGTISFTPNPGFTGDVVISYTISDGNGGTDTAVITVTVETAPLAANPDLYTSDPNQTILLDILGNDVGSGILTITNINGVPMTPGVAQSIPVSGGVVNISSTGLITFVPNPGFVGPISFPYAIGDTLGNTDTTTVQINILNNDAIALDDSAVTAANIPVALDLLANDSDPDGHTLSITSINGVALTPGTAQTIVVPHGLITISITGTITFIPDPLYTGPTGFPYTITDGNGGTDSANVSIDVLNTDPVAIDNYYTGAVGVSILLQPLVNDSDVDGHNLTITTINGLTVTPGVAQNIVVTGGTVTVDTAGNIIFIPNSGFTGSVAIPYTIIDGHGGTDTATIYINSTNNPPIAQNDTGSTIIGTPVILSPLGNDTDPDGNPLTITEINGTPVIPGTIVPVSGGTATLNPDGTISFTPNPGFTGDVVISYTISDGHGGTDTAVITISITGNPIAANDDAYTTQTNTPVVIDTLNNDVSPLGDDLTISSVNGVPLTPGVAQSIPVSGGVVNIASNGVMTFAPDTGFVGVVTFPYGVIDELGNTDTAIAIITVENTSPIVNNDSISTIPSTPVIIHPLTNDSDPDEHLLTITEINGTPVIPGTIVSVSGGTATLNPDGTISFTPNPGFTGDVVISYTISDGHGGTDTAVITVTVETAPLAANPDLYTSDPNQTILLDILGNDVGSGILTITNINGVPMTPGVAQSIPVSGGVVNISSTGLITFVPNPGFVGPISFPYAIGDTLGNTDTTTVQINILNNDAIALDDSAVTAANIPVALDLLANDSDPDGHTLSITSINGVALTPGTAQTIVVPNGLVTVSSTGVITFIPDPLYTGPIGFPYTISDGNGGGDTANVSIDVLNTDPLARNDEFTGITNSDIILTVLNNDSDVDGHPQYVMNIYDQTIHSGQTISTTGGKLTLRPDGSLVFRSDVNNFGNVYFLYTIDDRHGGTNTAQVHINVLGDIGLAFKNPPALIPEAPTPYNIETMQIKLQKLTKVLNISNDLIHSVNENIKLDIDTIATKILPKTGVEY